MISDFDTVEFLDDDETIAEYLATAMERGDEAHMRRCLADAAKARALLQLSKETGIDRDTIYKMLSSGPAPNAEQISPDAIAKVAKVFTVVAHAL
ncbi:MAG: putative addiction module antidote protein [Holophagales bacterium]|jgi:probable addiction module antidote protein|nr:putative addiction module antidote protein [Holophagales bacterium]